MRKSNNFKKRDASCPPSSNKKGTRTNIYITPPQSNECVPYVLVPATFNNPCSPIGCAPLPPRGLPGPVGPKGCDGPRGLQGTDGPRGAIGPRGDIGPTGPPGPPGTGGGGTGGGTGSGAPGPTGAAGTPGATGAAGTPGTPGVTGAVGPTGTLPGPTGATGLDGSPGPTGPRGPTGSLILGTGPSGPTLCSALNDVDLDCIGDVDYGITGPTGNDMLCFDGINWTNCDVCDLLDNTELACLGDVEYGNTGPTGNDLLCFDGIDWTNCALCEELGQTGNTMDCIWDVDYGITGPTGGNTLCYENSVWVPCVRALIGSVFFEGGSAGWQLIAGANKSNDEQPIVAFANGCINAITMNVPESGSVADGGIIYLVKIPKSTDLNPGDILAPSDSDITPAHPQVMAWIEFTWIVGGIKGPINVTLLPGETRTLPVPVLGGGPSPNPVVGFDTLNMVWNQGPAGICFERDEGIAVASSRNGVVGNGPNFSMAGSNFMVNL